MLHKINSAIDLPYALSNPPDPKTAKPSTAIVPFQQDSLPKDRVDIVLHIIGTRTISGGTRLLR